MYIVTLDDILYDLCKDRDHLKRHFGQEAQYKDLSETVVLIYRPMDVSRPFTATWTSVTIT